MLDLPRSTVPQHFFAGDKMMTLDERGLVALVITWHPLLWVFAMCLSTGLTWLATRFVRDVPLRQKPLWVFMIFFGCTCMLYGALTELFTISSAGVEWISLSKAAG